MKGIMRMGIIALFASLIGCGQKPTAPEVRKENLPPMPPNCPDLPELVNLRLKDGHIADVRIFRDGETTFYIPMTWFLFGKKASDFNNEWDNFAASMYSVGNPEVYSYAVKRHECPGVVHAGPFSYTTHILTQAGIYNPFGSPPNFGDGEIGRVHFQHIYPERVYDPKTHLGFELLDQNLKLYIGGASATVRVGKNHLALFEGFPYDDEFEQSHSGGVGPLWDAYKARVFASPRWHIWRASVQELYGWLTTRPKDRDNDRIFRLGVKAQ